MCNGSGVCRKLDVGTMCPSFQAVRQEMHSTRGRANLLRAALSGHLEGGLDSPALTEALDLCLGCKACKTECPSNVDMTRLKAETYAYKYDSHRPPLAVLASAISIGYQPWRRPWPLSPILVSPSRLCAGLPIVCWASTRPVLYRPSVAAHSPGA